MILEKISCILAIFISIWVEFAADMVIMCRSEYLMLDEPMRATTVLRRIVVHIYTCITGYLDEYKETYLALCREWETARNSRPVYDHKSYLDGYRFGIGKSRGK